MKMQCFNGDSVKQIRIPFLLNKPVYTVRYCNINEREITKNINICLNGENNLVILYISPFYSFWTYPEKEMIL